MNIKRIIAITLLILHAITIGMEKTVLKDDTEKLLEVSRGKILQELEMAMSKYVNSLSPEMQEALNWNRQFALFKQNLNQLEEILRKKINEDFLQSKNLYMLTALGIKPVTVNDLNPKKEELEKIQTQGFHIDQNKKIFYNTNPLFSFQFIKLCYPKINISEKFNEQIDYYEFTSHDTLQEWTQLFELPEIKENKNLREDEISLLLGYIPTAYTVRKKEKKIKYTPYDIEDIEKNITNFRSLGIPGVALLKDNSPYAVLYGCIMEYLTRYIDNRLYLAFIAEKLLIKVRAGIIEKVTQDKEYISFINDILQGTEINNKNISIEKIDNINFEQKILLMNNFLKKVTKQYNN